MDEPLIMNMDLLEVNDALVSQDQVNPLYILKQIRNFHGKPSTEQQLSSLYRIFTHLDYLSPISIEDLVEASRKGHFSQDQVNLMNDWLEQYCGIRLEMPQLSNEQLTELFEFLPEDERVAAWELFSSDLSASGLESTLQKFLEQNEKS